MLLFFTFMLVFSLWLRELLSCVKKSDVLMVLISSAILRVPYWY